MGKMIQLANMALVNNGLTPATKSGKPVHRVHTLSLSQAINLTLVDSEGNKIRISAKNPEDLCEIVDQWVDNEYGCIIDLRKANRNAGESIVEDIKDAIFDELLDGGLFEDVEAELHYFCGVIRHSKLNKDLKKGVLDGLHKALRTSNLRKFWVELRKAQMTL